MRTCYPLRMPWRDSHCRLMTVKATEVTHASMSRIQLDSADGTEQRLTRLFALFDVFVPVSAAN